MSNKMKKNLLYGSLVVVALAVLAYVILSLTYKGNPNVDLRPKALPSVALDFGTINLFGYELDIAFKWYAIFIMSGVLLCSVYGYNCYLKKLGVDMDTLFSGVTGGVIFGVLGARIWFVLFESSDITSAFLSLKWFGEVFSPIHGGLAIHGALYGLSIFVVVFCYIKKLKMIEMLEIVLPMVMLAQVIGRWGNFFNQEAFGPLVNGYQDSILTNEQLLAQRVTLRHLLVPNFIIDQMYLTSSLGYSKGVTGYYHPTFLYEGIFNLIGVVGYTIFRKKSNKVYVGDGVCFYLIWYGIVRMFIEMLRLDPLTFTIGNLTIKTAILVSVIFIITGIGLLILRRVKKFKLISTKEFFCGDNQTLWLEGYGPNKVNNVDNESKGEEKDEGTTINL